MKVRLIGDVHGKMREYLEIARAAEGFTLQIGDLGFDYTLLGELDSNKHRVLPGNHDNYTIIDDGEYGHFLPDYGQFAGIFYVRGGYSIDKKYRVLGVSYWEQEEVSYETGLAALELYKQVKPITVVTHECPSSIIPFVSPFTHFNGEPIRPSKTSCLLESMLYYWQPDYWYFGHHHKSWQCEVNGTKFRCLAELEYTDMEV